MTKDEINVMRIECSDAFIELDNDCDVSGARHSVLHANFERMADEVESVTAELSQHKTRLAQQSARLAASESELRRLRQVIERAPAYAVGRWVKRRLQFVPGGDVVCKLIPLSELEATNANPHEAGKGSHTTRQWVDEQDRSKR